MRPSDSPTASAHLRFALGRALPAAQALILCPVALPATWRAVGPLAAAGASEWVSGSPLPGSFSRTVRGLPGYRAVLFERATATHPVGLPSTRPSRLRECCFPGENSLEHRKEGISGLTQVAHSLAWLRFNRLLTKTTASLATSLQATLWLGGARTHRTTHQSFGLHPDLLSDRHCLVASSRYPQPLEPAVRRHGKRLDGVGGRRPDLPPGNECTMTN